MVPESRPHPRAAPRLGDAWRSPVITQIPRRSDAHHEFHGKKREKLRFCQAPSRRAHRCSVQLRIGLADNRVPGFRPENTQENISPGRVRIQICNVSMCVRSRGGYIRISRNPSLVFHYNSVGIVGIRLPNVYTGHHAFRKRQSDANPAVGGWLVRKGDIWLARGSVGALIARKNSTGRGAYDEIAGGSHH